ncbi:Rne/Rng family ribonuclease [Psychrobacter sp. I-STPA6b]|uniref:Rne/Rng family ribonuclease n=1 Tax=Psychrobacter sp. I-STPA6b TaxID=2585718 RepID=UPI001D0C0993|nr:Rne/Rng family ribonuclease [Psychrobacter sp. I-STPA6b]
MKRILINATHNEEIRVALCKGNHLYDFDLENRTREQKKANIYKGHVTRVEPSLEAVFVEYGSQRQGFLPIREIANEYLSGNPRDENIKKLIKEGDELIVQVEKEERGNKGAALSTYVSLAGRYLVLMPNNPRGGGISRQISGKLREDMKRMLSNLDLPKGMSVIIRTAGIGKTQEELQHDLNHLLNIWSAIQEQNKKYPSPRLVHQEAGVVTRAVRDYLRDDIGEIWIDNENAYTEAANFIKAVMPRQIDKLRKYTDYEPMFANFGIEKQIETAYQREVRLPSGGSIVIDQTEALVSIDINSAKSTKGSDVAETAYHTNLEAADEIARQLRLRDMGGLIVIDFIDMNDSKHQRDVEKRLVEATKYDRARVQFGTISKFGLMEMSRQRLRPSLEESTGYICPRCHGNGMIRDLRSLSLSIMRQIEQIALKERQGEVQAEVPTDIAAFLLNEKRDSLVYLEQDSGTRITILPHAHLESPQFKLLFNRDGFAPSSYERISDAQQQETSDLGYDVNWQTAETERPEQQPVRQPHASLANTPKSQTTVKTTGVTTPSMASTNNAVTETKPAAVAWLSNLFAPSPEAKPTDHISSQDAAQAIESIVNTGAKSRGIFGQVAEAPIASQTQPAYSGAQVEPETTQQPKEKDETNKRQRKSRHNVKSKHSKTKSRGSRRDERTDGANTKDNRQDNKRTETQDKDNGHQVSTEQNDLPKRSSHSRRESRGAIERSETLTASNHKQPQHKADAHSNKPEQKAANTSVENIEKNALNPNEINLRVSASPLSLKEPEVVHLSLDETANKAKKTEQKAQAHTTAIEEVEQKASSESAHTNDTTDKLKNTASDISSVNTDSNDSSTIEDAPNVSKQNDASTSDDMAATIEPKTELSHPEEDTDHTSYYDVEQLFAERYAAAKQYGKASNDPRVVRAQQQKQVVVASTSSSLAAISGSVGEFIHTYLPQAQQLLAEQGVIACFLSALQQRQTASQNPADNANDVEQSFSNYGYQPLADDYLSQFEKMTAAVAQFATAQGKTEAQPSVIGQRASNDPRGQHPDYVATTPAHEVQPTQPSSNESSHTNAQADFLPAETVGKYILRILAQHGETLLEAGKTETAFLQALQQHSNRADVEKHFANALASESQAQAVEKESEQMLHHADISSVQNEVTASDISDIDNNSDKAEASTEVVQEKISEISHTESEVEDDSPAENNANSDAQNEAKAEAGKTSVESYKSMIETVSEQLLSQTGLFNLTPAKVTPKAGSKVPKSRTRKPKTEHKKPTQAERQKSKAEDKKTEDKKIEDKK